MATKWKLKCCRDAAPHPQPIDTPWKIHPGRLTWNIIMEVWKIIFLSKWVICRFHVNLPGCTPLKIHEDATPDF